MSLRVGVLGSTRGTALQGVIEAVGAGALAVEIAVIIADRAQAGILARAAQHNIPAQFIDPKGRSKAEFEAQITVALEQAKVDVVLLIGYMRILSPEFVQRWAGRLLNVHPSLLPAFGGLMDMAVHEAVRAAGVSETGCTIHVVTAEVDGGPIVLQKRCPVLASDSVEDIKARVQVLESEAFVEVLQNWKEHG